MLKKREARRIPNSIHLPLRGAKVMLVQKTKIARLLPVKKYQAVAQQKLPGGRYKKN